MKIALKEYQEQAVAEVLKNLRLAATNYEAGRALGSMSLSAPTGSGKTVIAAAVIERVLYGDSSTGDALDPDAVILWITDDPSLNQQTRKKILEASDLIQPSQLIVVDDGFDEPEFEPGKPREAQRGDNGIAQDGGHVGLAQKASDLGNDDGHDQASPFVVLAHSRRSAPRSKAPV